MLPDATAEQTFVFFHGRYFRNHCCHILLNKCRHFNCILHIHPKDGKLLDIAQNIARRGNPHAYKTHGRPTLLFFGLWRTGIESVHQEQEVEKI